MSQPTSTPPPQAQPAPAPPQQQQQQQQQFSTSENSQKEMKSDAPTPEAKQEQQQSSNAFVPSYKSGTRSPLMLVRICLNALGDDNKSTKFNQLSQFLQTDKDAVMTALVKKLLDVNCTKSGSINLIVEFVKMNLKDDIEKIKTQLYNEIMDQIETKYNMDDSCMLLGGYVCAFNDFAFYDLLRKQDLKNSCDAIMFMAEHKLNLNGELIQKLTDDMNAWKKETHKQRRIDCKLADAEAELAPKPQPVPEVLAKPPPQQIRMAPPPNQKREIRMPPPPKPDDKDPTFQSLGLGKWSKGCRAHVLDEDTLEVRLSDNFGKNGKYHITLKVPKALTEAFATVRDSDEKRDHVYYPLNKEGDRVHSIIRRQSERCKKYIECIECKKVDKKPVPIPVPEEQFIPIPVPEEQFIPIPAPKPAPEEQNWHNFGLGKWEEGCIANKLDEDTLDVTLIDNFGPNHGTFCIELKIPNQDDVKAAFATVRNSENRFDHVFYPNARVDRSRWHRTLYDQAEQPLITCVCCQMVMMPYKEVQHRRDTPRKEHDARNGKPH